ncbi:hypothetical protein G6F46_010489 [Rhizopus delemar]|nr:hypothetical protein G6F52_009404 [Rhizopus delemar]KAG1579519.1 hypothetical protein G6F48_011099 [Rhizopus delemar]KAG1609822.1 hypothetical protein G6F46_010489 [Rhizopus delemar]
MLPNLPRNFDNKVTSVSQLNLEADESEMRACYTTSTTNNEEMAEGKVDETEENDNTEQDEQRVDIVEYKKRLRKAYETILMYKVPLDDLDRKLHRRIRMGLAGSCAELKKSKERTDLRSYFTKPSNVSITSKRIFEIAKAARDSIHEFKVSSLQLSSTVYSASRKDFLDGLTHDINKNQEEEQEEENEIQQRTQKEFYNYIKSKCADLQFHFNDHLTSIMYEMINNLFDELKQFQFDSDTVRVITYLDNKNKEINRENVCEATKRMQIINEGDVIYGKILELIVTSEQDVRGIELCSLEFRKGNASYTTLLYQQSKNLRINACILNEFHLWTLEGNISIAYLDFSGRNESISQIFKMNDQYVAHEVGKVVAIKNLLELEILRETMFNLFRWKKSLVNNSNVVSLAYVNQCNRFALADISNTLG